MTYHPTAGWDSRTDEPDPEPPADPRQLRLYTDPPPTAPYQPHSDTSRAAAASQPRAQLARYQARVLEVIRQSLAYGATDEEIARLFVTIGPNTVRPRRVELVARGLVRDSGIRRATASGRKATVWVAT